MQVAVQICFFLLILVMAIGIRSKLELCLLSGQLRWMLIWGEKPKERYSNSCSGCGSNTQPSNWEVDILQLSSCHIPNMVY